MSDVATIEPKAEEPKPKAQHNTMKFDRTAPVQKGMEKVPRPKLGMTVAFYEGGDMDQQPAVAFVTGLGMTSHIVQLSVISPAFGTLLTKEAVRHVNDPSSRLDEFLANGAWEFLP